MFVGYLKKLLQGTYVRMMQQPSNPHQLLEWCNILSFNVKNNFPRKKLALVIYHRCAQPRVPLQARIELPASPPHPLPNLHSGYHCPLSSTAALAFIRPPTSTTVLALTLPPCLPPRLPRAGHSPTPPRGRAASLALASPASPPTALCLLSLAYPAALTLACS